MGAINKGNVFGSQFHPEKSGLQGLSILQAFLDPSTGASEPKTDMQGPRGLAKVPHRACTAAQLRGADADSNWR